MVWIVLRRRRLEFDLRMNLFTGEGENARLRIAEINMLAMIRPYVYTILSLIRFDVKPSITLVSRTGLLGLEPRFDGPVTPSCTVPLLQYLGKALFNRAVVRLSRIVRPTFGIGRGLDITSPSFI